MRAIDADRLLTDRVKSKYYHLPNGDIAIPIIDIEHAPTVQPQRTGRCIWCDSPYRIEYYWIDRDGNTASFQDEERHIVATGIARFCTNCGARMDGES